jgi:Ca2+-binding EF-hand superfamily protein
MSQQSNKVAAKPAAKAKYKQNKQPDLSADQKQEIREAFDLFDTDGSGTHQFI